MKNVHCYRLGNVLHIDIQKGKEAMKISIFKKKVRGTAECINRQTMATKGFGQLKSNDTYFADIWFIEMKTAEEVMDERVDY